VHKVVLKLDWSILPTALQPFAIFAATLAGALALAALSWRFFEKPFLSLKAWFPRPGEKAVSSASTTRASGKAAPITC
jgi:peptidoglycan/LPS O-acetylase OafA/YrhL